VSWTIRQNTPADSLINNGLGQSPALTLRFVDAIAGAPLAGGSPGDVGPVALTPGGGPSSGTQGVNGSFTGPGSSPGPGNGSGSGSTGDTSGFSTNGTSAGVFSSLAPGGLTFTVASLPVGKPTTSTDAIGAVGPGSTALASSSSGLLQGIGYGQTHGRSGRNDEEIVPEDLPVLAPINGAMADAMNPAEPKADELALVTSDWIGRVGSFASEWLAFVPDSRPLGPVAPVDLEPGMAGKEDKMRPEPFVVTRDDSPQEASGRVERAAFGAPVVVGLGTMMALRYSAPLRRWFSRSRGMTSPFKNNSIPKGVVRGPHRKF
jgi:hypothetical protein